jgi:hypothetical protein
MSVIFLFSYCSSAKCLSLSRIAHGVGARCPTRCNLSKLVATLEDLCALPVLSMLRQLLLHFMFETRNEDHAPDWDFEVVDNDDLPGVPDRPQWEI